MLYSSDIYKKQAVKIRFYSLFLNNYFILKTTLLFVNKNLTNVVIKGISAIITYSVYVLLNTKLTLR